MAASIDIWGNEARARAHTHTHTQTHTQNVLTHKRRYGVRRRGAEEMVYRVSPAGSVVLGVPLGVPFVHLQQKHIISRLHASLAAKALTLRRCAKLAQNR